MTLNEIKKIIDEADIYLIKDGDKKYITSITTQGCKKVIEAWIEKSVQFGRTYIFFKFDDNGEVEKRWVVDHIDKEKKIVKKKLDEMTEDELKKLSETVCHDFNCKCCPLAFYDEYGSRLCLSEYFNSWKKQYLETKDREIEVEVE